MSKVETKIENNVANLKIDTNEDGQPVVEINLHMSEALGELIAKGEKVEGAKVADFNFVGTSLVLSVDTDRDGQNLLDIKIDLGEAFDEISSAVIK